MPTPRDGKGSVKVLSKKTTVAHIFAAKALSRLRRKHLLSIGSAKGLRKKTPVTHIFAAKALSRLRRQHLRSLAVAETAAGQINQPRKYPLPVTQGHGRLRAFSTLPRCFPEAPRSPQSAKIWLRKAPGQDLTQNGPFPNSVRRRF